MTARTLVITAALIVLSLILASCGGGATSTPTSVPPTEAPATQAATEEVAATPVPTDEVVTTEEPAAEATADATEAAGIAEAAGGVTLTVMQENTALRGGPGTNYEVIVRVTVNASYPVVATYGEGRNQWYQITLEDGTSAWAWARVVTLNPADAVVPVAAEVPPPPAS
ncbi:SH3 domain-containing protein [Candidatus Flexifilum breve]|uniref:SH3 domain-containing protein n=1 Tax=Candidatus Flexifilum breve TaxID=3140694 RepID=UPI0031CCBD0A